MLKEEVSVYEVSDLKEAAQSEHYLSWPDWSRAASGFPDLETGGWERELAHHSPHCRTLRQ